MEAVTKPARPLNSGSNLHRRMLCPGSAWAEYGLTEPEFHQSRPDTDNLYKAFSDAILPQDGVVFSVLACKVWCRTGQERIEATIASF